MTPRLSLPLAISLLTSILCVGVQSAYADRPVQLLAMHSGPNPSMECSFSITVDRNNALTGATASCAGDDLETYGVEHPKVLSLAQLQTGFVFMKHASYHVNIITVSAPDLDRQHGGTIRIHYLRNAMFGNYSDFYARVEKIGDRWITYTDDDNGKRPITQMRVQTGLLGVKNIQAD